MKGTKCESCCDFAWCWNALNSARDLCLGPFKNLEDFKKKFRESNKEGEISEEERKRSLRKHIRKTKLEEYRENRMQCDLFSTSEDKKDDE